MTAISILRLKRPADSEPISSLYLPVFDSKKNKTDDAAGEAKRSRLFRLVSDKSAKRDENGARDIKVLLLSSLKDSSGVKNAVVVDSRTDPADYDKLIKTESVDDMFCRVQLQDDDERDRGYVYDIYRMDLGVFALDSEAVQTAVEIVMPQHEFLAEDEGSDSEADLDDGDDSNAEDYYANDYPEEATEWGTSDCSDWDGQSGALEAYLHDNDLEELYTRLHECYGSDESIPDHSYRDYMPGGVYCDFD